jgi:adenylate kinase
MEPAIILLGPPGSGKGTQAERMGATTLSMGDLLRQAREDDTEAGRRAGDCMDRGELVPDDVIMDVFREALDRAGDGPVVLDGFPRTVEQAKALEDLLPVKSAVLLDLPDDEVVDRISHRDQGRSDDTPETARHRLDVYHEQTEPLVRFYEDRGLLRRVDGTGDPDEVAAEVQSAIA